MAALLALVVFGNILLVDKAGIGARHEYERVETPEAFLVVDRVWVSPGDIVRVRPPPIEVGLPVELWVVEPGGAQQLASGEEPSDPIARQGPPFLRRTLDVERPQPPARAVVDEDGAAPVEVVWVAREENHPRHEDARESLAKLAECLQMPTFCRYHVQVLDGRTLSAQPLIYILQGTLVAALLGLLALALFRRSAAPPEGREGPTERLLLLAERAQSYLEGLQGILRLTGILLVVLLVLGAYGVAALSQLAGAHAPSPRWLPLAYASLGLIYVTISALWLKHYLYVRHELRRWRAKRAEMAADLTLG